MLTYTDIHTNTRKQRKSFKAPYPRMRSDMKRFFFLGKPRKKGSALRASRASLYYYYILQLYYYTAVNVLQTVGVVSLASRLKVLFCVRAPRTR